MKNITSNTKSSVRDYWSTQMWFVRQLERIGKVTFVLDPCAGPSNSKAIRNFDENDDGLLMDWCSYTENAMNDVLSSIRVINPAVFINPPFSQMDLWISKVIDESSRGLTVFFLHPDTSDTAWYQKIEAHCTYQLVPTSRLNYLDPETGKLRSGVNFQSCVSVFAGVHTPSPPRIRFDLQKPLKSKIPRIRIRNK